MSQRSEEGVSPVVGVMLMLVVTIIIASVVSAFAGGLWGSTDKAPGVTIQASVIPGNNITLTHMGGDPFQLKDVKLIVSNNTWNGVYTNTSSSGEILMKVVYNGDTSPMLIRAGDKFVGNSTTHNSYFTESAVDKEYKWTLVHIPSQKTIATGKAYPE